MPFPLDMSDNYSVDPASLMLPSPPNDALQSHASTGQLAHQQASPVPLNDASQSRTSGASNGLLINPPIDSPNGFSGTGLSDDSTSEPSDTNAEPAIDRGVKGKSLNLMTEQYKHPDNFELDRTKLSLAIQAGFDYVRDDLETFMETHLSTWLKHGLWPESSPEIAEYSLDMMFSGMERIRIPGSEKMLRRIARVRLFYWYEDYKRNFANSGHGSAPGVDRRTMAIDYFLEHYYDDWHRIDNKVKKKYRNKFHAEKHIGKKWCQLVRYFSPGILVICGRQMDVQMLW
jgi:hypothetical protein